MRRPELQEKCRFRSVNANEIFQSHRYSNPHRPLGSLRLYPGSMKGTLESRWSRTHHKPSRSHLHPYACRASPSERGPARLQGPTAGNHTGTRMAVEARGHCRLGVILRQTSQQTPSRGRGPFTKRWRKKYFWDRMNRLNHAPGPHRGLPDATPSASRGQRGRKWGCHLRVLFSNSHSEGHLPRCTQFRAVGEVLLG